MTEKHKELLEIAERKNDFKNVLEQIENYYFKEGGITFSLSTTNFGYNEESIRENIPFDKKLIIEYLNNEIIMLDKREGKLIKELYENMF